MGMGMPAVQPPDVFGVPIFKVTKTITQRVGDEVHILCGCEIFGQTQWHYICVMNAADLLVAARECTEIAQGNPSGINLLHEHMSH